MNQDGEGRLRWLQEVEDDRAMAEEVAATFRKRTRARFDRQRARRAKDRAAWQERHPQGTPAAGDGKQGPQAPQEGPERPPGPPGGSSQGTPPRPQESPLVRGWREGVEGDVLEGVYKRPNASAGMTGGLTVTGPVVAKQGPLRAKPAEPAPDQGDLPGLGASTGSPR